MILLLLIVLQRLCLYVSKGLFYLPGVLSVAPFRVDVLFELHVLYILIFQKIARLRSFAAQSALSFKLIKILISEGIVRNLIEVQLELPSLPGRR